MIISRLKAADTKHRHDVWIYNYLHNLSKIIKIMFFLFYGDVYLKCSNHFKKNFNNSS